MPIWRSSELLVGRPGSPSRRNSARSSNSYQSSGAGSGRPSGLPPLGFSPDGIDEGQPPGTGPYLQIAARPSQVRRGASGCSSANSLSSWETAQVTGPGLGFTAYAPTTEQQEAAKSPAITPRRRVNSAATSTGGSQTYTVQYIGIANGELGILSQKQKLAPPRLSGSNTAPSVSDAVPRRRSHSAVARPSTSLSTLAAVGTTALSTTSGPTQTKTAMMPSSASTVGIATTTEAPTATALASSMQDSAGRAAATLDVLPPPVHSTSQSTATSPTAGAASALQLLRRDSSTAQAAGEKPPQDGAAVPNGADGGLCQEGHTLAAVQEGGQPLPAPGPPPSAEQPPADTASVAGSLAGAAQPMGISAGGHPAGGKVTSLTSIVDDAHGQVRVITECFYSRALHSRAGPHDRHARRNRPVGPQVRDMEPLSTGMPRRFRAPSAAGFPGWKLMAGAATMPVAATAQTAAGLKSRNGIDEGPGAGGVGGGSRRLRASSAGPVREEAVWAQNGPE